MGNYDLGISHNLGNYKKFKVISLTLVILLTFFSAIPTQPSFESSTIFPVGTGSVALTYRDISNTSPTPDPTITLNPSIAPAYNGQTITITVDDFNGNLKTTDTDFVSATVTMSSVTSSVVLTETANNSHIFEGTFSATSQPSVSYEGDPPESGRATITPSLATAGDVRISDVIIDNNEIVNMCFRPVTHAVKVELLNGASLTSTNTVVKLSYANAILLSGDSPGLLQMYYKKAGQNNWALLTPNFIIDELNADPSSFDFFAKTVTSDPAESGFGSQVTEGQFILGFDTGCGGGGGGGLVRPGLVVNALAGLSAIGGGGSGPPGPTITLGAVALHNSASETISMPQEIRNFLNDDFDPQTPLEPITDTYEDFDLPLSINGNGFALGGYENTLVTQTIEPGVPNEFNVVFYTNSEIAHTSLYFNLGPTKTIAGSDTQVLLYKDRPIEIIDPNGNIATATGIINNEGELKRVVTFSITFFEDIQWSNSDLVIRAWNDQLNSGDTIVYDAIQIAPSEEQIAFEESIPEPEVEQLKSQHIPIWIKNNANWWSQELIEDADFVAGLEYLIQNNIVTIPDSEITINEITTQKIPSWIKNTAGWWSENQITEKEFIDGLQWLISNGIIKVVET